MIFYLPIKSLSLGKKASVVIQPMKYADMINPISLEEAHARSSLPTQLSNEPSNSIFGLYFRRFGSLQKSSGLQDYHSLGSSVYVQRYSSGTFSK